MRVLFWVALPLTVAGLVSCTSLVGGALLFWASQLVAEDLERVGRGELDAAVEPALRTWQGRVRGLMGLCALTWVWQGYALRRFGLEGLLALFTR